MINKKITKGLAAMALASTILFSGCAVTNYKLEISAYKNGNRIYHEVSGIEPYSGWGNPASQIEQAKQNIYLRAPQDIDSVVFTQTPPFKEKNN
jgi:hypothetical protein